MFRVLSLACSRERRTERTLNANAEQQNRIRADNRCEPGLAIGSDLLENNETEKAIDALLRATELNPDLAEAWFKLGIAYALIEKQQALGRAVRRQCPSTRKKQGKPNSEKAFRKAIEAYKKILAQNPDDDVS